MEISTLSLITPPKKLPYTLNGLRHEHQENQHGGGGGGIVQCSVEVSFVNNDATSYIWYIYEKHSIGREQRICNAIDKINKSKTCYTSCIISSSTTWGALHRGDHHSSRRHILQCNIARCCSVEIFFVIMMQQVKFETSMKNIPLGGNKEYVMQLTKSME